MSMYQPLDNKLPFLTAGAMFLLAVCVFGGSAVAQDEAIELPEDYVYEHIYTPTVAGLSGLIASHDGTIYVRHLGPGQEVRVSRLDVDQDELTRVLTLPPWASAHGIVGGPGDSFFIEVGGEMRQVQPDGSYTVWNTGPPAGMPEYYTLDGHMLAIGDGGTSVIELFPDGTSNTLLSGLTGVYDLIAADDGTIFISDFPAAALIRLDPDGSSSLVTSIVQDNTDLAIDQLGNLYINNAASGFARVDLTTGSKTPMWAPLAPCPVVRSPALVLFDSNNRAIFGSWVENRLTWVDFSSGTGAPLISQSWANTTAADLGSDDALYLGVTGCGTAVPTEVVRFDVLGQSEVVFDGLTGDVGGFTLDGFGGFYISLGTETSAGTYHVASGSTTPDLVPGTLNQDVGAMSVDPITGHLFAFRGMSSQQPPVVTIGEFTGEGEIQHQVAVPKAPAEFLLDFAPDGTLYAYMSEADRFTTGPCVDRWILSLDVAAGTSTRVASVVRHGCCPFGSFGVDHTGSIWWLLNPDSLLYQVAPADGAQLFASNVPVDAGYANRTAQGDIFLNTPEGLFRIWLPTPAERVELVGDIVEQFIRYGELSAGQGQALMAKLEAIIGALQRGQTDVVERQTVALLAQLRALTRAGILDEALADVLIVAIDSQILGYL